MPTFVYSAHGPSGVITGELSASDRSEAFALLGKKKIQPIKLEAAGTGEPATGDGELVVRVMFVEVDNDNAG